MGLKAAPADQALLLDLQEFDTRLQRLGNVARSLPEAAALAALEAELEAARRLASERLGIEEDIQAELGRVDSDVKVVEARIERDRGRLQGTSSVKDVQALEQELAALAKRQDELEEIELVVMERLEEAQTALSSARAEVTELESRVGETAENRDLAVTALETERRAVEESREALAARIPADLLALYEKQRARYGVGASLLRGGVSAASGVALTATDLGAVRTAAPDDVLLCPDSSAILVRTAESGL
ncbi:zinc ribbon domain-containing protein [Homoserinibacter sp. GY 40078]|uniref:zinc ribbon domain-containing protein n=1 Tax=Homoserinibacter sp. GY 40078 TaxID=2603275 RepID=UPI0011CC47BD|nr:hypothetical protein [Homoserinibacter sp. GY 40078]TXK17452.1 hypothetical protein FVQ89_11525 [Homoserinibacter sp. GY 40078]